MSENKSSLFSSKIFIVLLVFASLTTMLALAVASSYIGAVNFGNAKEQELRAARDVSRSTLAQYGQQVMEVAQVPSMYADDVTRVTREAIEGRYGEDGSRGVFQWIQEQNPQIDASLYLQVQRVVESGRRDFIQTQARQVDIRRQYETALGSFWQGMWLRIAGYPKVDLDEFNVVSTARADAAFETQREDAPIQLRPSN